MKILMIGQYEFWNYRRAETLYNGLKENKIEIDTCLGRENFVLRAVKKLWKGDFDVVLVNGILPVMLVWMLKIVHRKPTVHDVFISKYNTEVEDRENVKKGSMKAWFLKIMDKLSCSLPDLNFLDTQQHTDYFINTFSLKKEKFRVVYVGASDEIWRKKKIDILKNKRFNVVFWGGFSPLHGTKTIVKAANRLKGEKDILFHMLGFAKTGKYGQKYSNTELLAKKLDLDNIIFRTDISLKTNLVDFANSCDVCLGIFGDTTKAKMVIPHKVYETIALGKPLITMNSKAIREIFINNENCLLVKPEDDKALADAVLKLKKDSRLRKKVGECGNSLYNKKLKNKAIGKQLLDVIGEVL